MPLRFGPYRVPRCKIGDKVDCRHAGRLRIVAISDAAQQWPLVQVPGHRIPALCGDLICAVRREAASEVANAWGVAVNLVTKWRKALRVKRTPGEHLLRSESVKATDPERARKVGRACRGKPRPRHVLEALRKSHLGKPLSDAVKGKIAATHKRRGIRPPGRHPAWSPREYAILRRESPAEAARRTGRTISAVYNQRNLLGITRKSAKARAKMSATHKRIGTWPPAAGKPWTAKELRIVKKYTPQDAVERTGRTMSAVRKRLLLLRAKGEMKRGRKRWRQWTAEEDRLVRSKPPVIAAKSLRRTIHAVRRRRLRLKLE